MVATETAKEAEKALSSKVLPLMQEPDRLEERLKEIPPEPGVYYMRDATDQVLYIGKSKKLRSRVRQYFNGSDSRARIHQMVRLVTEIEFIVTDTEAESLTLEANLIRQYKPPDGGLWGIKAIGTMVPTSIVSNCA
jgi:excinuclease ABC subunit C